MKRIHFWLAVDTDGSVITSVFDETASRQEPPQLRGLAEADVRDTFEGDDDIEEQVARTMGDMCPVRVTIEAEDEEQLARGLVAGHPELFAPGHHNVEAARLLVQRLAADVPQPPSGDELAGGARC
jgi:hypothetical protein